MKWCCDFFFFVCFWVRFLLQLLFLCLNSLHFRNQEEQESEGQSNMKTVMGEAHGAGFGFFLYTTLEHIPFNQYNFYYILFYFQKILRNWTPPALQIQMQYKKKVKLQQEHAVLFCLVCFSQIKNANWLKRETSIRCIFRSVSHCQDFLGFDSHDSLNLDVRWNGYAAQ